MLLHYIKQRFAALIVIHRILYSITLCLLCANIYNPRFMQASQNNLILAVYKFNSFSIAINDPTLFMAMIFANFQK